jgi:AraC family transcriptional regulator
MNPVQIALWFVESHFAEDLTLEDVAAISGCSRHHMTRAFGAATGQSLIRYMRGRRLTEAARILAKGAPDILTVAIETGYGSHEAFTRAFRNQFKSTPEQVRDQRHVLNIALVEPIDMNESPTQMPELLRFDDRQPTLIAGLNQRYSCESTAAIPSQWQRFTPHIGNIPNQLGEVTYGVCHNVEDSGDHDYLCGVEVADFSELPAELTRLRIPAQKYAVFAHRAHVSTVRSTFNAIWNRWAPNSKYRTADAPFFERYGREFDPRTGSGGFEIWIPLQS